MGDDKSMRTRDFFVALALACVNVADAGAKPRVVAQYYGYCRFGAKGPCAYPATAIDYDTVTHLVLGVRHDENRLAIDENGVPDCKGPRATWNNESVRAHALARQHGLKVQIGFTRDEEGVNDRLMYNMTQRGNFMGSIKAALHACDVDGFEIDWEGPGSDKEAEDLTNWMLEAKAALGPSGVVSLDSEPPQWNDYKRLNATILAANNESVKEGFFVNYMSYFLGTNKTGGRSYPTMERWTTAAGMLLGQGSPASTINLAIPYYQQADGAAGGADEWWIGCANCPNLDPAQNWCAPGFNYVGKLMNKDIGELVRNTGIGVFPWVLDYDVAPSDNKTCGDNSLFKWLRMGLQGA